VVGAFVVALVLAEGGVRAWFAVRGTPYDGDAVRAALEQSASPARLPGIAQGSTTKEEDPATKILNPYLGWTDVATIRQIESDAPYFRGPESEANFDVFIMGGSTAFDMGKLASEHLRERLASDARLAGRTVRVFNYAKSGYRHPQPVTFLAWLLALGFQPDAIFVLDGFNEVSFGASNALQGVSPVHPYAYIFGALASRDEMDASGLDILVELRRSEQEEQALARRYSGWTSSAIVGTFVSGRVSAAHARTVALHERWGKYLGDRRTSLTVRGPSFDPDPAQVGLDIAQCWYAGSLAMHGIAQARGARYVHVLQPTLLEQGSKAISPEEERLANTLPGWVDGVRYGYPAMREWGQVLRTKGVRFVDATRLFRDDTETLFTDACHMNEIGMKRLSDEGAREILDALSAH